MYGMVAFQGVDSSIRMTGGLCRLDLWVVRSLQAVTHYDTVKCGAEIHTV